MKTTHFLFNQFKRGLSTEIISPELYVKPSFKKAREFLYAQKYDEAALHFSNWLDTRDVYWTIRENGIERVIAGHEFALMAAFFGSRKINTSTNHLLEILPKDLGKIVTHGQRKTTAIHLAATYGGENSANIFEIMMNRIKAESREGLLVAIDSTNDTPIEKAVLQKNKEFIKLSRSICDKPSAIDLKNMQNLGWYRIDRDEFLEDFEEALFNTSDDKKPKLPRP